jgi:hypothetical protein
MEVQNIADDMMCWSTTHIQMCGYFINCHAAITFTMASTAAMPLVSLLGVSDRVEGSLLQN